MSIVRIRSIMRTILRKPFSSLILDVGIYWQEKEKTRIINLSSKISTSYPKCSVYSKNSGLSLMQYKVHRQLRVNETIGGMCTHGFFLQLVACKVL